MSNLTNLKTIKRFAKKVPKKKIIKKAGTFMVKQLVGGNYLDLAGVLYKGTKDKAISYAGNYAYEKFMRSNYTREKINSIPLIVLTLVIRIVFNFLIVRSLKSEIWWIDFIVSITITVITTLLSPFIYVSIEVHKDIFKKYTEIFIENFLGPNGYEYLEMVKNVIMFIIAVSMIIVLQFVEISSRYIQYLIIHAMITGGISDLFQRWIDRVMKRRVWIGMTYIHSVKPKKFKIVTIPYKTIQYCHTKNREIIGAIPERATIVKKDKIKDYIIVSGPDVNNTIKYFDMIEDYNSI
jgi:hypothetical protein